MWVVTVILMVMAGGIGLLIGYIFGMESRNK